ncbi:MAG: hypothetical protein EAY65_03430 [Alphaproteobacteria bacterium]|nr:MAG: hypothetical protein EAY65_03430 [Alphaproteobacteria bacterium]
MSHDKLSAMTGDPSKKKELTVEDAALKFGKKWGEQTNKEVAKMLTPHVASSQDGVPVISPISVKPTADHYAQAASKATQSAGVQAAAITFATTAAKDAAYDFKNGDYVAGGAKTAMAGAGSYVAAYGVSSVAAAGGYSVASGVIGTVASAAITASGAIIVVGAVVAGGAVAYYAFDAVKGYLTGSSN